MSRRESGYFVLLYRVTELFLQITFILIRNYGSFYRLDKSLYGEFQN